MSKHEGSSISAHRTPVAI